MILKLVLIASGIVIGMIIMLVGVIAGSASGWNFGTLVQTLTGGVLAILGGLIVAVYQVKNSRRMRLDERMAEEIIKACQQAYVYMKEIQARLIPDRLEDTDRFLEENEEWFWRHRLFLPKRYAEGWLEIRNHIKFILEELKNPEKNSQQLAAIHKAIRTSAEEAIDALYKVVGESRLEPRNLANTVY